MHNMEIIIWHLLFCTFHGVNLVLSQATSFYERNDVNLTLDIIERKLDFLTSICGSCKESGKSATKLPWTDCKQILDNGHSSGSGVYDVYNPTDGQMKKVYCDMDSDGGGWMIIQRRRDASVKFSRNWNDYRNGFGDLNGNLWLGNEFVHHLTMYKKHALRVDLQNWENESRYALYNEFFIGSNEDKFKLTVAGYGGTAGDSLEGHSGFLFTTHDQDNDIYQHNCAAEYCPGGGGWWFSNCEHSFLNGRYVSENPDQVHACEGLSWDTFGGEYYSLKRSEMKIRPYF